jgi:hypothetical protein
MGVSTPRYTRAGRFGVGKARALSATGFVGSEPRKGVTDGFGPQRVSRYLTFPEMALLAGDPRLGAFRARLGLFPVAHGR